jgi:cytoskeletal protein CcmA (bactofilin family)
MAIFKNSDEQKQKKATAAPRTEPAPPARSKDVSVIGSTLVFKGELSADEDLIIEGKIEGTIAHHKKHLTIGERGRVKADIHARSVIVLGQLVGDIHSEGMVTLAKGATVIGDIFCASITMENGVRYKGSIDMIESAPDEVAAKTPASTQAAAADNKDKPSPTAGRTAKASVY